MHSNELPPMARLPACTLRSVFAADATIFRDLNGDLRDEQHYFDDFLCLRGEQAREEVMRSIRAASGAYVDNFEENMEEESDENPCPAVNNFQPGESEDEYDDSVEAAVYNTIINAHTPIIQMSDDSENENNDLNVGFTVHTREITWFWVHYLEKKSLLIYHPYIPEYDAVASVESFDDNGCEAKIFDSAVEKEGDQQQTHVRTAPQNAHIFKFCSFNYD